LYVIEVLFYSRLIILVNNLLDIDKGYPMVLEDKKAGNAKKIENNKDIEDDQELKEELNEWEVESTEAGD
jgi:hypothetical protein